MQPNYVQINSCRIAYFSVENPGKTVLLLHGTGADSQLWEPQTRLLATKGFNVLAMDFRGHGRSGPCPIDSWNTLTEDILGLMENQKVTQRVILMGHSIGAMAALKFAETYPERVEKVLVVGITPRMNLLARKFIDNEVRLIHRHQKLFLKLPKFLLTRRHLIGITTSPMALIQCVELIKGWDIYHNPLRINVPLYGCAGQFDLLMPPSDGRKFKELCPAILEFATIPFAGHSAMDDRPELFNRWMMGALEK